MAECQEEFNFLRYGSKTFKNARYINIKLQKLSPYKQKKQIKISPSTEQNQRF
jgi:hypothetical protein